MIERRKGGSIVHVSNIAAQMGFPNLLTYAASKGALDSMMRVMAVEWGPHQVGEHFGAVTFQLDLEKTAHISPVRARYGCRFKFSDLSQIAKFMGPTWGPSGSCRPQMGPMLVPGTLLLGMFYMPLFALLYALSYYTGWMDRAITWSQSCWIRTTSDIGLSRVSSYLNVSG